MKNKSCVMPTAGKNVSFVLDPNGVERPRTDPLRAVYLCKISHDGGTMQKFEHGDNIVTIHDDGSMILETKDGRKIEIDPEGKIKVGLKSIRSVGIKNVIDLDQYAISRHEGLTAHSIRFKDGGGALFAYEDSGALAKFQTQSVSLNISKEGDLLLSMRKGSQRN